MNRRVPFAWPAIVAAGICLASSQAALGACRIDLVAHLRVSVAHGLVTTSGRIDGKRALIGFDTGSSFSYVWRSAAQRLGLPVKYLTGRIRIYGVGGQVRQAQTFVERLRIQNLHASKMRMLVLGSGAAAPLDHADLVLGDDVLLNFDLELDLAHGTINFLRQKGCKVEQLPYWTRSYSEADLENGNTTNVRVRLNGQPIDATLDSGTSVSIVSRWGAQRAGIEPWVKDPHPGRAIPTLAGKPVPFWVGRFDSFSIGGESISHAPLEIADLFGADKAVRTGSRIAKPVVSGPEMILGVDFLMAHHVLVLPRKGKLLFTYDGGPVFRATAR